MDTYSKHINVVLKNYRVDLNADRVVIALLHQKSLGSLETVFTVLLEELSPNTKSIYPIVKNIPPNVINLEFKNDLDSMVVAVKRDFLPTPCTHHLEAIECKTLINTLLKFENFYWGILSFQFKEIPPFINNDDIIIDSMHTKLIEYRDYVALLVNNHIINFYKK